MPLSLPLSLRSMIRPRAGRAGRHSCSRHPDPTQTLITIMFVPAICIIRVDPRSGIRLLLAVRLTIVRRFHRLIRIARGVLVVLDPSALGAFGTVVGFRVGIGSGVVGLRAAVGVLVVCWFVLAGMSVGVVVVCLSALTVAYARDTP